MRKRPRPSVQEHQAPHRAGVAKGVGQADGAAPVVQHKGEVREPESAEQLLYVGGVSLRTVRKVPRCGRAPKPQVIWGDAAVGASKRGEQMAVQPRARRVAVEKYDGGAPAHVGVHKRARSGAQGRRGERIYWRHERDV